MSTIKIKDEQWRRMYTFLKSHSRTYTGNQKECRCFVEGVHWVLHNGAQWRELPEKYGKWNSVYKRFKRKAQTLYQNQMLLRLNSKDATARLNKNKRAAPLFQRKGGSIVETEP